MTHPPPPPVRAVIRINRVMTILLAVIAALYGIGAIDRARMPVLFGAAIAIGPPLLALALLSALAAVGVHVAGRMAGFWRSWAACNLGLALSGTALLFLPQVPPATWLGAAAAGGVAGLALAAAGVTRHRALAPALAVVAMIGLFSVSAQRPHSPYAMLAAGGAALGIWAWHRVAARR